jgi:RNA recognition motif-containing protein
MASSVFTELFINNLAVPTTEEALKQLFSPYGVVESCWVTEKKGNAFGVVRLAARAGPAGACRSRAIAPMVHTLRAQREGSRPTRRPSPPKRP